MPAQKYSWERAAAEVDKLVEDLKIPWAELHCATQEVEEGNLLNLSNKLARGVYYIVAVNHQLTGLLARRSLLREVLDLTVHRTLATEAREGRQPALALRTAVLITSEPELRKMKITLMEANAKIEALGAVKDSLEALWRTASRIISARLKEPLD